MVEIAILVTFLVIFCFLFQKDKKDRERSDLMRQTLDNTVSKVLDSVEKTNTVFYEIVKEVQIEHFRQLSEHTEKILKIIDKKTIQPMLSQPIIEKLGSIDNEADKNMIEKEDVVEVGLDDATPFPVTSDMKVQIEGDETIYPINIT